MAFWHGPVGSPTGVSGRVEKRYPARGKRLRHYMAIVTIQVHIQRWASRKLPPFWNTRTTNNLYGVQIGVDAKMLELGRFSLHGLMKTGIFDNNAQQSTGVSLEKVVYPSQ